MYLVHGPPVVGGVAVAVPWVGPVAAADVRAGAVAAGIVRSRGADAGVTAPETVVATTETSYEAPGARPFMGQFVGEEQVTVTGTPPPFGTAVKVKEENGPPFFGGDAVRLAVFDEVGVVEAITGPLQCIVLESSETKCLGNAPGIGAGRCCTDPAGGVTSGSALDGKLAFPDPSFAVTVTS